MNRMFWTIPTVTVVAAVAACLAIQRHAAAERRQHAHELAEQEIRLNEISERNRQLAMVIASSTNAEEPANEQLRELARLRGKIRALRETAVEEKALEATNARLRVAISDSERKLAAAQAAPNYWPRDQLTFAGYANPESAMKSMLWVMNNGDVSAWKSACTPQARAGMEREWKKHGISEEEGLAEMKTMARTLMGDSSGFHIVDTIEEGPDKVTLDVSFDGEGKIRKFVLKKLGDEWRFHDLLVPGQGPSKSTRAPK